MPGPPRNRSKCSWNVSSVVVLAEKRVEQETKDDSEQDDSEL
jgi:hypothetical protein